MMPGVGERMRVFWAVARDRSLRRLEGAFAGFAIAEHATWISIIVYAYERGGVTEAGLVTVVQLAPAVAIAPFAAYAGDRFRRDRVLAGGYTAQAVGMAVTALSMSAGAGPVGVYGAATLTAVSITFTRPAMGAILPAVTRTPADLTAANVAMGFLEHTGMFVGPLVAAGLLAVGSPATVFATMAGVTAIAAVAAARLPIDPDYLRSPIELDAGAVAAEALAGFRVLGRELDLRLLVLVISVGSLFIGVADVLFVTVAEQLLDGGASQAGVLSAGFGIGAVAGSGLAILLVGRARITPFLVGSLVTMAVPMVALATVSAAGAALALFTVMGAGESLLRISGATMVQRVAPTRLMARVFGVLEGLQMLALAVGSISVAWLVEWLGLRAALVTCGVVVPLLVLVRIPRLLRIDRTTVMPPLEVIERLRADPVFSVLSAPTLDRLAAASAQLQPEPGTTVIRQGEPGDRYYLVLSGTLEVTIDGAPVRTMEPGSSFGEIALLRAVPRTATVTAGDDVELLAVSRDDFLAAVTGHPASLQTADQVAQRRLANES